jgi:hypothetical protein
VLSQSLSQLAAESGERHLPMSPVAFGLLMFAGFIALLVITFAFRSSGTKH